MQYHLSFIRGQGELGKVLYAVRNCKRRMLNSRHWCYTWRQTDTDIFLRNRFEVKGGLTPPLHFNLAGLRSIQPYVCLIARQGEGNNHLTRDLSRLT